MKLIALLAIAGAAAFTVLGTDIAPQAAGLGAELLSATFNEPLIASAVLFGGVLCGLAAGRPNRRGG